MVNNYERYCLENHYFVRLKRESYNWLEDHIYSCDSPLVWLNPLMNEEVAQIWESARFESDYNYEAIRK